MILLDRKANAKLQVTHHDWTVTVRDHVLATLNDCMLNNQQ